MDDAGRPHPRGQHLVSAVPLDASSDRLVVQIPISINTAGEATAYPEHVSGNKNHTAGGHGSGSTSGDTHASSSSGGGSSTTTHGHSDVCHADSDCGHGQTCHISHDHEGDDGSCVNVDLCAKPNPDPNTGRIKAIIMTTAARVCLQALVLPQHLLHQMGAPPLPRT